MANLLLMFRQSTRAHIEPLAKCCGSLCTGHLVRGATRTPLPDDFSKLTEAERTSCGTAAIVRKTCAMPDGGIIAFGGAFR